MRGGFDDNYSDYVQPDFFYLCLEEFLDDDSGTFFKDSLRFSSESNELGYRPLVGYKLTATTIKIESVSSDGPAILQDLRRLEKEWGIPNTYSYAESYLDFEQYFTFRDDTIKGSVFGISAVTLVVFFITGSFAATLLVMLSVLLVSYFLLAVVFFWGLTYNSVIVV